MRSPREPLSRSPDPNGPSQNNGPRESFSCPDQKQPARVSSTTLAYRRRMRQSARRETQLYIGSFHCPEKGSRAPDRQRHGRSSAGRARVPRRHDGTADRRRDRDLPSSPGRADRRHRLRAGRTPEFEERNRGIGAGTGPTTWSPPPSAVESDEPTGDLLCRARETVDADLQAECSGAVWAVGGPVHRSGAWGRDRVAVEGCGVGERELQGLPNVPALKTLANTGPGVLPAAASNEHSPAIQEARPRPCLSAKG